jgi:hypothetical protein
MENRNCVDPTQGSGTTGKNTPRSQTTEKTGVGKRRGGSKEVPEIIPLEEILGTMGSTRHK